MCLVGRKRILFCIVHSAMCRPRLPKSTEAPLRSEADMDAILLRTRVWQLSSVVWSFPRKKLLPLLRPDSERELTQGSLVSYYLNPQDNRQTER